MRLIFLAVAMASSSPELSPEIDYDAPLPEGPLLLPGKLYPLNFSAGALTVHGLPIIAIETPNSGLGTGTTVWDGSVVLAKYLEHTTPPLGLAGRRVLELGAGPGVTGFAAAALGAEVALTDLPYVIPNLEAAATRNAHLPGRTRVAELDWFTPEEALAAAPFLATADVVLGADVVWLEELIPGLVRTLALLLRRAGSFALIAHQTRSTRSDQLLFQQLAGAALRVEAVPRTLHHPAFSADIIAILRITADAGDAAEEF